MPDISSIGHSPVGPLEWHAAPAARREIASEQSVRERPPVRPGDRVELSDHARFLDRLQHTSSVRHDRIETVRQAIIDGSYDTATKLEVALDRLLDSL